MAMVAKQCRQSRMWQERGGGGGGERQFTIFNGCLIAMLIRTIG